MASSNCTAAMKLLRKQTFFLILIMFSIGGGIVLGLYLNPSVNRRRKEALSTIHLYYLNFPGIMFLHMLKLIVVPLAVCSNISALSSLKLKAAGLIGGIFGLYLVLSNLAAVAVGLCFCLLVKPGTYGNLLRDRAHIDRSNITIVDNSLRLNEGLLELFINLVPPNLFQASFMQPDIQIPDTPGTSPIVTHQPTGPNILGLLGFAIFFGIALHHVGESVRAVTEFFLGCRLALTWMVSILLWYFPIGIFSLISSSIARTEDLAAAFSQLKLYISVKLGSLFVVFLLQSMAFLVVVRKSPLQLIYDVMPALTCAFGTCSSSGTLPLTMRCLKDRSYADQSVVMFLIPPATTLNMNGTAVLQGVAPIFFLQCLGTNVGWNEVWVTIFLGLAATMVCGTTPSGGLATMVITLAALNIPTDLVSLIVPVDWFLDRIRTPLNVYGDVVATGIVSKVAVGKHAASNAVAPTENPHHQSEKDTTDHGQSAGDAYILQTRRLSGSLNQPN